MAGTSPEAPAERRERPLSPHLQVYRWPLTMLTSILHRATGVAAAGGAVLLTAWLVAAAAGPDTFGMMRELLASIFGRLVLFGFTVSLVYHLLNGIRHLAWDTGAGLGVRGARLTGYLVFAGTIVLTLIIWIAGYHFGGSL
jgi:succinate dehydrogenase / fumarate reductase cytochrome b subunit